MVKRFSEPNRLGAYFEESAVFKGTVELVLEHKTWDLSWVAPDKIVSSRILID